MVPSDLLKGSLKSIVLKMLADQKRMYGYEITQRVEELSEGKIKLTFGALYPILHKLETDGLVKTESEIVNNRNRIYYSLTKTGQSTAKEKVKELEDFINTLRTMINPKPYPALCKA
ncbi:MAG TPA: PadR family transcriptional regulator [Bacteroidales bacterium]|nr:PadR family transcriptional regulator [Bacteroidales bacterium]